MLGAESSTDNVAFIIGFSAGGVLIATIVGLWLKSRYDKKNGKEE
jgi:Ni/Fe-hydrogenase subunit HybB-like protein